jgi:hypothetical protein
MSEFVYLYRSGARPSRSPEQAQQEMQRWMAWLKELTEKGHIKDPGHPLERTGKLVTGKARTVTDGPFAEAKEVLGGFNLIEADTIEEAIEMAATFPWAQTGCVEVRPVRDIGAVRARVFASDTAAAQP